MASQSQELTRRYHAGYKYIVREALSIAQGGRCGICNKLARLVVDHDHRTKRVRGALCNGCNIRLGMVEDEQLLKAARRYLRTHRRKATS